MRGLSMYVKNVPMQLLFFIESPDPYQSDTSWRPEPLQAQSIKISLQNKKKLKSTIKIPRNLEGASSIHGRELIQAYIAYDLSYSVM